MFFNLEHLSTTTITEKATLPQLMHNACRKHAQKICTNDDTDYPMVYDARLETWKLKFFVQYI